jgi:hypothetical protein
MGQPNQRLLTVSEKVRRLTNESFVAATIRLLFLEVHTRVNSSWRVTLSKHVSRYGPRSGFRY